MLDVILRNTTNDDDKILYGVDLVLTQTVFYEDVELQMEPEDVRMHSQKAIKDVNVIVATCNDGLAGNQHVAPCEAPRQDLRGGDWQEQREVEG